ncbi:ead/Ea22-like family protein [Escherichia sp. E3659]|uniref:ead/Ea22-like family protein n=1 Tax=Escherichia sp. E3659 TaxID=2044462 RepID=UPI00107FF350|nr:ead/Ea22-like family protein [Escherichia sp. E3659]TGB88643.1 hypothetical protein CRI65_00280 [Escherichia sp. E3659]TLJ12968.1 ead/Ea22-like family protein [Escherichia sp. E3659]
MSKINYQALRDAAQNARDLGGIKNYKRGEQAVAEFESLITPHLVLALLDELEIKSKRINELIKGGENAKYVTEIFRLEKECMALAAENAGLKAICDDRRRFIMNAVQLGHIKVPAMKTKSGLETIRIAISPQKPTPATDVFLAEVRAWAFNDLCAAFVRHAKVAGLDDADTVTLNEATDALLHCVEQLRAPE